MKKRKLAVVAIGGNALIPDAQRLSIDDQYQMICMLAEIIADMETDGWRILLTHGNGPQVGFIMRRSELASHEVSPVSMDTAGADLQGGIGYMFVKALRNSLARRGIKRDPVAIITHTIVERDDPAFAVPTKPIGSWMSEDTAREMSEKLGWTVCEDSGRGWRRVVASPLPCRILEQDAIAAMVEMGFLVIAGGGGGIPVLYNDEGELEGVEAVIDKDRTSAILANALGAGLLMLPTGVERVALDFGKPDQRWLDVMTMEEAASYMKANQFGVGSMEPKIAALMDFVGKSGCDGVITSIPKMREALEGKAGTRLVFSS